MFPYEGGVPWPWLTATHGWNDAGGFSEWGYGVRGRPVLGNVTALLVTAKGQSVVGRLQSASRWRPRGTCRRCGYDLKGNGSGDCPEYGTTVAPGQSVEA